VLDGKEESRLNWVDSTVVVLRWAAVLGYGLAFLVLVRAERRRAGARIFALAWLVNAGLILVNWLAAGYPPLANMYHVLTFLSVCFLPLWKLFTARDRLEWLAPYFAFASVIPLVGSMFLEADAFWRRMPALQSPWFVPHVVAYMVSYALAMVAFAVTAATLWRRKPGFTRRAGEMHAAAYRVLKAAFPLMTFGMLSGALWAEEAWGTYWSWDPKEVWSLVTWTLYLAYFHCRKCPPLRRYAVVFQVCAFLSLLTTFLLVNLLPRLASVLHSYT
jgi:ABC-type transport system involved in cytochrome c biogenesis permease subunit